MKNLFLLPTDNFESAKLSLFENKLYLGDVASTALPQNNGLELKQETTLIEEAKKLWEESHPNPIEMALFGAKWQQERSYSEEEVLELLDLLKRSMAEIIHIKYTYKDKGHCIKYLSDCETIIEQFKKK